jgi:hypothetical protein
MRRAFIIAALAAAILLHVYTWKRSTASRSLRGQSRAIDEVSRPVVMLADIRASQLGERISVAGQISDIWEPAGKRAPHTIILRDDSAALEIVHWLKHLPRVDIGDSVKCTGTVDLYRGGLQLRLWTPGDLQVLKPSMDTPKTVGLHDPASP